MTAQNMDSLANNRRSFLSYQGSDPAEGETMSYTKENNVKADFNSIYTEPPPHKYISTMAEHGYRIGEKARPYFQSAVQLLEELNGEALPVQMLDLGCSYGIGSALVKYGCSFDELTAFYSNRAPTEFSSCCDATRMWLNVVPPACNIRCVGLDSSAPAIDFALHSRLLDAGISRDYELAGVVPTQNEAAWFQNCNLLVSTGAIGYVTEQTLAKILCHLGKNHSGEYGPFVVVSILRMFDIQPIREVFWQFGLDFKPVPGVYLPQRRFIDKKEEREVLKILGERGVDSRGLEDNGELYCRLYVAGPEHQLHVLFDQMIQEM